MTAGRAAPRVLITTSTFPAQEGDGTPRFVRDLAAALSRRTPVTVLAPDAPGAPRRERAGDLEIERFSYFAPRGAQRLALGEGMRDNLRASWLARLQVPSYLLRQAWVTRRIIERRHIDVVNPHWMVPQGLTAALAMGRRRRARLLLHVHAGDVYLLRRLSVGRAIARFVMSRTDGVLADGSHVRDTLDELLGYRSGAGLRPMGVDPETFGDATPIDVPPEFPEGFLLFFGRLAEKKGVVHLVRALPAIFARHPGLGLIVIGDGPERPRVEREASELGVMDRIRFPGRRSHAEIGRHLKACRVAVIPSIIDSHGETEGMPTVVLEAMAAGARVVASRVDGVPDVVRHGENGWLAREQDPEDLAEQIGVALADTGEAVPNQARATAEANSWDRVAEAYLERMGDLLGQGGAR